MMLRLALLLALIPGAAAAFVPDLGVPVERVRAESEPLGSVRLPVGGWRRGGVEMVRLEGHVSQEAFQARSGTMTTLQLLAPMRRQLVAQGFSILFDCRDRGCGGFDFRYSLALLPEPDMHVDLGDYRYLLARRGDGAGAEHVALMVSRSSGRGFVQVTRVAPEAAAVPSATAQAATGQAAAPEAPAVVLSTSSRSRGAHTMEALAQSGRAVLEDLSFATGSARLDSADAESLTELAVFLADNPALRVVLVGHTDMSGTLAGNLALSRGRADSVRARLIEDHGISPARIEAQGVGPLAPRADNATAEGRTLNRRVEVLLAGPG